jgi:hypothetical protein
MSTQKVRRMPLWKRLLFGATFGLVRSRKMRAMPVWQRLLIAAALCLAVALVYRSVRSELHENSVIGVGLTGFQHIGPNFNIAGFYVDGYYGGTVGREGGGGGEVCCVVLPRKWRPGLVTEVRWAVADWSNENRAEIDAGNYRSVTDQRYKAIVPVEKYLKAENFFVHFYPGGKVRVVSGLTGLGTPERPVMYNDPRAVESATSGYPISAIFSKVELDEMESKYNDRTKYFGNWK